MLNIKYIALTAIATTSLAVYIAENKTTIHSNTEINSETTTTHSSSLDDITRCQAVWNDSISENLKSVEKINSERTQRYLNDHSQYAMPEDMEKPPELSDSQMRNIDRSCKPGVALVLSNPSQFQIQFICDAGKPITPISNSSIICAVR